MNTRIETYLNERAAEFGLIDENRKESLRQLAGWIREKRDSGSDALLLFICTHNSRRSHLAQVWGNVCAEFVGLSHVQTFSGGTEATACYKSTIAALKRAGLEISTDQPNEKNPVYKVRFNDDPDQVLECYSKKFTDQPNPQKAFCAVMTCSSADEACPFVPGAEKRIATPYTDPKVSDGSVKEDETYDERCRQIARELLWTMREAL